MSRKVKKYEILFSNVFKNKNDENKKLITALIQENDSYRVVDVDVTYNNDIIQSWQFVNDKDEKYFSSPKYELSRFLKALKSSSAFKQVSDDYDICSFVYKPNLLTAAICDCKGFFHIVDISVEDGVLNVSSLYDFKTKDDINKLITKISDFVSIIDFDSIQSI